MNIKAEQVGETQESSNSVSEQTVPIVEATDEDLDSFLSSVEDENPEPLEDDPDGIFSEDDSDGGETGQEELDEEGKDLFAENNAAAGNTQDDSTKNVEDTLRKENEELAKRLKQTEEFVQRRNSEIGELRKKLLARQKEIEENLESKSIEDPKGAVKDGIDLDKIDSALESLDAEEQFNNDRVVAEKFIAHNLKGEELDINAMCAVLEQDGADARYVQAFRSNPLQHARPTEIVLLGKRAAERSKLNKAVAYLSQVYQENQKLKEQLKKGPKRVLDNIQKNLRASSSIMDSSLAKATKGKPTPTDVTDLTESELDELLNRPS